MFHPQEWPLRLNVVQQTHTLEPALRVLRAGVVQSCPPSPVQKTELKQTKETITNPGQRERERQRKGEETNSQRNKPKITTHSQTHTHSIL